MPLILTDEQQMLAEAAGGFFAEQAPVAHLRALRDSRDPDGLSRPLWRAMGELGLAGVLVPEEHGGSGLGAVEAGVIAEAAGRTLAPSPFLSTAVLAARALAAAGEAARAEWLPRIAAGEAILALAVDEGPKHRPDRIALEARRAGNGFRLDGAKGFVVDGHVADRLVVAARTAGAPGQAGGLTLFLVDPKARGVNVERTVMVDSRNAARVAFAGVEVDADAVIGEVDGGSALLDQVLDLGRAAVAAEMTGAATAAFEGTLDYLKTRRQFGRAIGEFQALQHRAAHLFAELEITRAAVLKALQAIDADPAAAAPLVAVAKARAGRSARLATQEAVQMHGGVGMTDELDVGLYLKRVRVAEELFGDAAFHADRLARLGGY